MASAVKGPLGRFRKHDSPSPLHERWGDVRITVPTEGSWNQYENPRQSSLREGTCSTGFVPAAMSRSHDDETAPLTEYDHRIARPSSLSVKALNPRRLSVRLNPRSKTSNDSPQEKNQQPTTKAERRRSQFAYRPIQQDYPPKSLKRQHSQSPVLHDSNTYPLALNSQKSLERSRQSFIPAVVRAPISLTMKALWNGVRGLGPVLTSSKMHPETKCLRGGTITLDNRDLWPPRAEARRAVADAPALRWRGVSSSRRLTKELLGWGST